MLIVFSVHYQDDEVFEFSGFGQKQELGIQLKEI